MPNSAQPTNRVPASALPIAAQFLQQLHPATGVAHVGTGQGLGAIHQWRQWGVEHALLIDAASEPAPWLEAALAAQPGWQYRSAVVAATQEPLAFYTASNPSESSTLQPHTLQSLWPNLRTLQQQTCTPHLLDALAQSHQPRWQPDWLLVDCLPALPVLQGAAATLQHCKVVWVRATLDAALPKASQLEGIEGFLLAHHFKPLLVAEGLNPALCEAIFVRDMDWAQEQQAQAASKTIAVLQAEITQLREVHAVQARVAADRQAAFESAKNTLQIKASAQEQQAQAASKTIADLQTGVTRLSAACEAQAQAKAAALAQRDAQAQELAAAIAERDTQAQLAAERQAAFEAAAAGKDVLQNKVSALEQQAQAAIKAVADLQAEVARLSAASEAQAQEKAAALAQRDAQAQELAAAIAERDTQARLAAERQAALEAANATKDALQNKASALDQQAQTATNTIAKLQTDLNQARTSHQQELDRLQHRLQELEAHNQEGSARQQLMQEELVKAEAQIELIKDLLLREPSL